MKKTYVFMGIIILALLFSGCGSTSQASTENSAASGTEENAASASEIISGDTAGSGEETADDTTASSEEADTTAASYEEAEAAFSEVLNACACIWPGSAGSSLRGAKAAAMLLDWSETYGDLLSAEQVTAFVNAWIESASEDYLANLQEAWESAADSARTLAEDPTGQAALLEDAGYVLQYDTYTMEKLEVILEDITSLLTGTGTE